MDLFATQALNEIAAAAVIADGLDLAKVKLFKTDVAVDKNTVLADLTEADYVGYASEAVTWLAPTISEDGEVEVQGIVGEFRPTNDVTPNDVYGVWVTNDAGTAPLLVGRFDDGPYPMNNASQNVIVTLRYRPQSQSLMVTVS
jgi:predicted exporter